MIIYARKWIESDNYVKWSQLELQNQIPNMECSLYVYINTIYKNICVAIFIYIWNYIHKCVLHENAEETISYVGEDLMGGWQKGHEKVI